MVLQLLAFGILAITLGLFLYGRWRHDIVALFALLLSVAVGLVPADNAFSGFSHPAVITVACVLILSGALQQTGVVDLLAQRVLPNNAGPMVAIAALMTLGAALSSFMNNVGALALLMPVALQTAQKQGLSPGKLLMPLSLGTMLGGMTTLIGTPSNLIVSSFRNQVEPNGFSMFAFTPVGLTVAIVGILFISLIGWRIIPARERAGADTFNTGAYFTEARVAADSKAVGLTLREAETMIDAVDAQILSLVRNNIRLVTPHPNTQLQQGDILLIEADSEALANALQSLGLVFNEERKPADTIKDITDDSDTISVSVQTDNDNTEAELTDLTLNTEANTENAVKKAAKKPERATAPDEFELIELVILPGSRLSGRTARNIEIRKRFGVNLLAISRQGSRIHSRVRSTTLRHGDVLLVQGTNDLINEFASSSGCAPLAPRDLRAPDRKKMLLASAIMLLAIGLTTFNITSAAISFAFGVLLIMVTRVIPLRRVYGLIEWPVIVLLGALLPVAHTMETTGAANLIATGLLAYFANGNITVALVLIMVITMTITDVVNNAATAAMMSPIAIGAANHLQVNADPFLMAVAIGSSCAFMTPIGHQNNTLIMGPGGFRFGDYWPLGLPLEIIVLLVSVPALLFFWPV